VESRSSRIVSLGLTTDEIFIRPCKSGRTPVPAVNAGGAIGSPLVFDSLFIERPNAGSLAKEGGEFASND
jgi:hypothetical protein